MKNKCLATILCIGFYVLSFGTYAEEGSPSTGVYEKPAEILKIMGTMWSGFKDPECLRDYSNQDGIKTLVAVGYRIHKLNVYQKDQDQMFSLFFKHLDGSELAGADTYICETK